MLNNKKIFWCLLFIFIMLISALPCRAQSNQLNIQLSEVKTGKPGEFITIAARLHNKTEDNSSYNIDVNVPEKWPVVNFPASIKVKGEEEKTLFITIRIPEKTLVGKYSVDINLKEGKETIRKSTVIDVLERRSIDISRGKVPQLLPGNKGTYKVKIINNGNCKETVQIRHSTGKYDWEIGIGDTSILLEPGEIKNINIKFKVPDLLEPGENKSLKLITISNDEQLKTVEKLPIKVLPPIPELVTPLKPDSLNTSFTLSTGNKDSINNYCRINSWGEVGEGHKIEFSGIKCLDEDPYCYNNFRFKYQKTPWQFYTNLSTEKNIYRIIYDQDPWLVSAGNINKKLSKLVSARGEGIFADYKTDYNYKYSLLLLNNQKGFKIKKVFPDSNYKFIYIKNKNKGEVKGISLENNMYKKFWVNGEIANIDEELAKTLGIKWKGEKFVTGGQYYWYDGSYPYTSTDKRGYKYYFNSKTDKLPFNLEYEKTRNNIVNNPDFKTLQKRKIIINTYLPWKRVDVSSDIKYSKVNSLYIPPNTDPVNKEIWNGDLYINKQINKYNLGIRGYVDSVQNNEKDVNESDFAIYPEIGYDWGEVTTTLGYGLRGRGKSISKAKDNLTTAFIIGLDYRPNNSFIENISLDYKGGNQPTFSLNSQFKLTERFEFNLDAEVDNINIDPEWKVRTGLTTRFNLPVPGVYSKGNLKGRVYLKEMDDKIKGIESIVLKSDYKEVSTDSEGYFKFPPFSPGEYELDVKNVPINYKVITELPKKCKVNKGEETVIDIILKRVTQISGKIYYDREKAKDRLSSEFIENEDILSNISIELWQDSNLIKTVKSDNSGFYQISNIKPGIYKIKVKKNSLPDRFEVTTENPVKVNLVKNEKKKIDYGIAEKELEIDVTFNQ